MDCAFLAVALADELVTALRGGNAGLPFGRGGRATSTAGGIEMDLVTLSLILVGVLVLCLALGLWVGFFADGGGPRGDGNWPPSAPAGSVFGTKAWAALNNWDLTALPMFIWMGEILFRSRLSSDMFRGLAPFTRRLPGGAVARQHPGLCALRRRLGVLRRKRRRRWGGWSLAELKARGYDDRMAIGTLAGSGTFGFLIPPSIILIVYGAADRAIHSRGCFWPVSCPA